MTASAKVVFVPVVVKSAVVEICIVLSFEIRAIVRVVPTVMVVALPYRVIVVNISGELRFISSLSTLVGSRGIFVIVYGSRGRSCVYRRLLIDYRGCGGIISGSGRDIHSRAGDTEADVGVDINLRIAFSSDEAGGYNGGKNEYLFHICRF
jgi:hypothetical protein